MGLANVAFSWQPRQREIPVVVLNNDEIWRQLRYVKVSNLVASLERFPDFLIVGPQRTGTTWLHANLREHPEIFLAEPKELFFFSRIKTPEHPKFRSDDLTWYLSFFRDPLWRVILKQGLSIARHRRLYRPLIRGEATASYAAIDGDVIADIVTLNPNVKVILMVRNPIDRAWSHAKKDLVRNRGREFSEVPNQEFEDFFSDPYQLRCAQYVDNVDNWASYLKPENLYVGAFDDIAQRPSEFMVDVLRFLGVSDDLRYVGTSVDKSVNPAGAAEIPPQHRQYLEALLSAELDKLFERYGLSWNERGEPQAIRKSGPIRLNAV